MKKQPCKMCGKMFAPKKSRHFFCQRRCFKLFDYRRHRVQIKNKFPIFNCPTCNNVIELNFSPIRKPKLWLEFKCPHCNVLMINVVDEIKTLDLFEV